jgi:hypothetical protein
MSVNVNKLKKCHAPPKGREDRKQSVPTPIEEQSAFEWDSSDNEPMHLLWQRKFIPTPRDRHKVSEKAEIPEAVPDDQEQDNDNAFESQERQGVIGDTPSQDRSRSEVTPSSETQGVTDPQEGRTDTVDGERNGSDRGQLYPTSLDPYQVDETVTRPTTLMCNLGLAGFVCGQGRTRDLDKGIVLLYHQDLIVMGNFWNVVVNLDLKWYRSQLDLIDVILEHVETYQRNPGQ